MVTRRRPRQRRDPGHDPRAHRSPHRRVARRGRGLVLQEASVIGNTFTVDLIAATATNPETVPGALAELVVAELLRAPSDLEEDLEYGFKSPVVREVAYQSILHRRRPAYHRRVAEALVAQQSDNEGLVELLADHYLYADDPENGVKYLDVAAGAGPGRPAPTAPPSRCSAVRSRSRRGTPERSVTTCSATCTSGAGYSRMVLDDRDGAIEDLTAASNADAAAQRVAERIEVDERLGLVPRPVASHRRGRSACRPDQSRGRGGGAHEHRRASSTPCAAWCVRCKATCRARSTSPTDVTGARRGNGRRRGQGEGGDRAGRSASVAGRAERGA